MLQKRRLLAPELVAIRMSDADCARALHLAFQHGRVNRTLTHNARPTSSSANSRNARCSKQLRPTQSSTDLTP